jgi:hypothetical protein
MTIAFQCPGCANVFKVPDSMAGRKGKCPRCGTATLVPPAGQIQTEAPPPRPAIVARKARGVDPESVEPEEVIEEDEEEETPQVRKRAHKSALDEEVEADEREVAAKRPKKRGKKKDKKRSPLLLYGLLGGFGLLVVCSVAGVVGWWLFAPRSVIDELKFMPDHCQMIATIHMDELLQSGAFKELRRELPEIDQAMGQDLDKEMGISLDDVEKLVIGGLTASPNDTVTVVRTKKPVYAPDLRTRMKSTTYTETKVGKYLLQEPADASRPAFCVPDKTVMIVGKTEALRAVLKRDKKPVFSESLQLAMKQVDFSKTIGFAMDARVGQSKPGVPPRGAPPFGSNPILLQSFDKADGVAVQSKFGSDVRLDITVLCRDPKSAEDLHKLISLGLGALRNIEGIPKEVADLLDPNNFKVTGNNVLFSSTFKVGPFIQTYKMQKGK